MEIRGYHWQSRQSNLHVAREQQRHRYLRIWLRVAPAPEARAPSGAGIGSDRQAGDWNCRHCLLEAICRIFCKGCCLSTLGMRGLSVPFARVFSENRDGHASTHAARTELLEQNSYMQ